MIPITSFGRIKKAVEKIQSVSPSDLDDVDAAHEITLTLRLTRAEYLTLARVQLLEHVVKVSVERLQEEMGFDFTTGEMHGE